MKDKKNGSGTEIANIVTTPKKKPKKNKISSLYNEIIKTFFHKISLTLVISLFALIAAIGSAYYAYESVEVAKESARNAVMPILDITITDFEEDSFITLKNHGEGTAILYGTTVTPRNQGEDLKVEIDEIYWGHVAGHLLQNTKGIVKEEHEKITCADTYPLMPLGSKEEKILLKFVENSHAINSDMDKHIQIKSCYCSIYDDCWETEFKKGFKEINSCANYQEKKLVTCK